MKILVWQQTGMLSIHYLIQSLSKVWVSGICQVWIAIIVSEAILNLSMNWYYSYIIWLVPIDISERGTASVPALEDPLLITYGQSVRQNA